MLSIGDFSQLGQVTVRTLRLYDDMGLLKPVRVDRFTNYRYYSLDQLPRLNRILMLKDLGLSLEQIAGLLNDNPSVDDLRGLLAARQAEIERELRESEARLARVRQRLSQIEQEGSLPAVDVVLKEAAPQHIVSIRQNVPALGDMSEVRCTLYEQVYDWLDRGRVDAAAGSEFAMYHNPEYVEQDIDMEVGVFAARTFHPESFPGGDVAVRELPAEPLLASLIYRCRPDQVGQGIVALFGWLAANDYSTSGAWREIHLYGRHLDLTDYSPISIEVQVPVRHNQP